MCTLDTKDIFHDSPECYKMVAKNLASGKYYSIATGIEYVSEKKITIPKVQKQIGDNFYNLLLEPLIEGRFANSSYCEALVGRTAAFEGLKNAKSELRSLKKGYCGDEHEFIILKVKFLNSYVAGTYGSLFVYAGKVMKILEEVNE